MTDPCDPIEIEDVEKAQEDWCQGLLKISRAYKFEEDYHTACDTFLDDLYDFKEGGRVFFRPTLAEYPFSFRTTREGTRSYFIGEEPGFPEGPNGGFAKTYWIDARYDNRIGEGKAIQMHEDIAVAMGNVFLREDGATADTIVDKLFVYRRDSNCKLKLIGHMSAKRNVKTEKEVE